jgi:hypothetical protein
MEMGQDTHIQIGASRSAGIPPQLFAEIVLSPAELIRDYRHHGDDW